MEETSTPNVTKLREMLESQFSDRPKLVRLKNTFGKVAAIVQELNSNLKEWVILLSLYGLDISCHLF